MIWLKYAAIGETREHLSVPSSDDMMTLFPEVDESIRPSQNILTPIRYDDRINARSLPSSSPYIKPGNFSGPARRARMCCRSKPTGEQRRATRRAGRLLVRWQALLPRRRPAIPSRARRMCESRACHLTYTRSERCEHASNGLPACINSCKH